MAEAKNKRYFFFTRIIALFAYLATFVAYFIIIAAKNP